MARRARHRQVEIFNFSFLDILACTIGLLIFIMVMVFVLQANSVMADLSGIVARKSEQVRSSRRAAEQDATMVEQLEGQLAQIHSPIDPALVRERDSLRGLVETRRRAYNERAQEAQTAQEALDGKRQVRDREMEKRFHEAESRLADSRRRHEAADQALAQATAERPSVHVSFLPVRRSALDDANFQVLHVVCHADRVVLLNIGQDGVVTTAGESSAESIGNENSAFAKAMRRHVQLKNPLVLFWVRPDGMQTFETAQHATPADMPHGFEPADPDWNFAAATAR